MTAMALRGAGYRVPKNAAYPLFLAQGLGNCATYPNEMKDDFTEDGHRAGQIRRRERARRVCAGCPFLIECRDWAMDTKQEGVYGATTTQERRRIRARG